MVYTCGLFQSHGEKGIVTSSGTLLKTNIEDMCVNYLWKSIKHIVINSITHHVDNSKGQDKVSTSHLQVGELLLLMGDGLLHQDTFNALFHCIFLCLGSENRVWITNGRTTLHLASFVSNHKRSYPLQCFLLLWGERRKAKLGARALSILHRQSFTSLEFTTSI